MEFLPECSQTYFQTLPSSSKYPIQLMTDFYQKQEELFKNTWVNINYFSEREIQLKQINKFEIYTWVCRNKFSVTHEYLRFSWFIMEDLSVIVFPKLFTSQNVYSEIISSLYALLKRQRCWSFILEQATVSGAFSGGRGIQVNKKWLKLF